MRTLLVLLLSLATLLQIMDFPSVAAQVMQSQNYQLQSDSINIGGGLGSSTSYGLESTIGEVATGESTSTTYSLKAGYQQMQEVYIALTAPDDVILSPSLGGVSGGTSNGSTTMRVTTDSPSGYSLSIAAASSPAMVKEADTIFDYAPVGGNPDFSFTTDPTDAQFGFSPEGADVATRYRDDNGSACGGGSFENALTCWDGLSTTERVIALRTSSNHPSGSTTTIQFRVGIGGSVVLAPGTYVATTTVTALPL